MATQTQEIRNMRLISHDLLNGYGNIGEGGPPLPGPIGSPRPLHGA